MLGYAFDLILFNPHKSLLTLLSYLLFLFIYCYTSLKMQDLAAKQQRFVSLCIFIQSPQVFKFIKYAEMFPRFPFFVIVQNLVPALCCNAEAPAVEVL